MFLPLTSNSEIFPCEQCCKQSKCFNTTFWRKFFLSSSTGASIVALTAVSFFQRIFSGWICSRFSGKFLVTETFLTVFFCFHIANETHKSSTPSTFQGCNVTTNIQYFVKIFIELVSRMLAFLKFQFVSEFVGLRVQV